MNVPIVKLELDSQTLDDCVEVLRSGAWAEGKHVHALEEEFAAYTGTAHAKAVNNGTAALLCALHAIGLKPGDEVLVPSFTFIASVNTILNFGARPVFVDVDRATFNMDVEDAAKKVTPKTKAIMPVHLYGLAVDMDPLCELAGEHGLKIVEDACQAVGAEYKGRKAGALGDVAAFSMYPTKNMVCGGEGGLVTTSDDAIAEKVRLFSNHGQAEKYVHVSIGFNFRMQEINAVVARASLKALDATNEVRRANAKVYDEALADVPGVETPVAPEGRLHVYHQYTLKAKYRDALAEHLHEQEIGYGIHYGIPCHQQKALKNLAPVRLPVTESLVKEVISIPVNQTLSTDQLQFVADTIKAFYS
jgi:dTDP-4-amino-4,6-dideoxygalactose transaminase